MVPVTVALHMAVGVTVAVPGMLNAVLHARRSRHVGPLPSLRRRRCGLHRVGAVGHAGGLRCGARSVGGPRHAVTDRVDRASSGIQPCDVHGGHGRALWERLRRLGFDLLRRKSVWNLLLVLSHA